MRSTSPGFLSLNEGIPVLPSAGYVALCAGISTLLQLGLAKREWNMDIDMVFALIVGLGAIPLGFWTFWSALKNKASFMEAGKAKEIAMFLGKTGARVFYMLCGLLLMGIGMLLLLALLGIVKLPKSTRAGLQRIPRSMASISFYDRML
jgi:hypothetical protein